MGNKNRITAPTEIAIWVVTSIFGEVLGIASDTTDANQIVQDDMVKHGTWRGMLSLNQDVEPELTRTYKYPDGRPAYYAVQRQLKVPGIAMYMLRDKDGDFLTGDSHWVPDVAYAKMWTKPGPARTRITQFADAYPNDPIPDIAQLVVGKIELIDDKARLEAQKNSALTKEERRKQREAAQELQRAKANVEAAQQRLESANAGLAAAAKKRLGTIASTV